MSFDLAISVQGLTKCFEIYDKPRDRLLQMMFPRRKFHRDFVAVKDVSFTVKRGEAVAIIGRNGSGKSTLLQMVCGTLNPSSGSIQINGKVAALLELGAGFNPEFTGRENVYLSASIYGLSEEQITNRFADIEAFAEIGNFIDQPVKTYSSGMFVRLAFAVIAHVDADILVIDEALAVGDVFFTQKCMRFIREFMKTGALLFVSHDTSSVVSLCNKALWLDKGHVRIFSSAKEVCSNYLEEYYSQNQSIVERSVSSVTKLAPSTVFYDQRSEFINSTNLRNDLEVLKFKIGANSFGSGSATIVGAHLADDEGKPLNWVVGGEVVVLKVIAETFVRIEQPIVGFVVKNKVGQDLFGDNSYISSLSSKFLCKNPNELIMASFKFLMPIMPAGDYSISLAIANGTQEQHEMLCWVHDAIIFKSHASSVSTGLVGLPMFSIVLE